jgi:hypothetical protein
VNNQCQFNISKSRSRQQARVGHLLAAEKGAGLSNFDKKVGCRRGEESRAYQRQHRAHCFIGCSLPEHHQQDAGDGQSDKDSDCLGSIGVHFSLLFLNVLIVYIANRRKYFEKMVAKSATCSSDWPQ